MAHDFAELLREEAAGTPAGLVPAEYFVRQRLANFLAGPVLSKKAALRVNMARINTSLDRGDRALIARRAPPRRFIQREWLD